MTWAGAPPLTYQHSEKADRLFCGKCGSQLAYLSRTRTDQIDLYTASLEAPEMFPPTKVAFGGEALSFTGHIHELPDWS